MSVEIALLIEQVILLHYVCLFECCSALFGLFILLVVVADIGLFFIAD